MDNLDLKCRIAAKNSVGAAFSLCSVTVFLQQNTNYKAVNIQSDGTMCWCNRGPGLVASDTRAKHVEMGAGALYIVTSHICSVLTILTLQLKWRRVASRVTWLSWAAEGIFHGDEIMLHSTSGSISMINRQSPTAAAHSTTLVSSFGSNLQNLDIKHRAQSRMGNMPNFQEKEETSQPEGG